MRFAPVLTLVLPLIASAQPSPSPSTATPPTAHASRYLSPFDGHRSFQNPSRQSWGDAIELVRRIGGWQALARESQEAAKNVELKGRSGARGGGHDAHPRQR